MDRIKEETDNLHVEIAKGGKCELDGEAYDYASIKLCEISHWIQALIEDSDK